MERIPSRILTLETLLLKWNMKHQRQELEKINFFYCNQRGVSTEDAVSMIVNGFCKEVFNELPMEFAVEAQKLMEVSLEGAVG